MVATADANRGTPRRHRPCKFGSPFTTNDLAAITSSGVPASGCAGVCRWLQRVEAICLAARHIREPVGILERSSPRSTVGARGADRVPGEPRDTHELAIHHKSPDTLRVAAGDGYFESDDAGATWRSPMVGLEVGYLRSLAIDPEQPEVVVVSASSVRRYVAGRSDGRLYRRLTRERWERVRDGWPEPASTIAPLLCAGAKGGELRAADERGVHCSNDDGASWRRVVGRGAAESTRPCAGAVTVDHQRSVRSFHSPSPLQSRKLRFNPKLHKTRQTSRSLFAISSARCQWPRATGCSR